jgi:Na+/proline symporter
VADSTSAATVDDGGRAGGDGRGDRGRRRLGAAQLQQQLHAGHLSDAAEAQCTDRQLRRVSQASVVAIGLLGIFIAIAVPVVLDALLLGYSITAAGLFVPLILGRFWKGATHAGAIAGILAGVAFTLLFHVVAGLKDTMPAVVAGLLASLIAFMAVSKWNRWATAAIPERL